VVYAVLENDSRRLLAYHIISQVGYMVAGVGLAKTNTAFGQLAFNGACAHAFAKLGWRLVLTGRRSEVLSRLQSELALLTAVHVITLDVRERALEQFVREADLKGEPPVVLMEMTLRQLTTGERIDETDFLNRADMLSALGKTVLISNFRRFHRLAAYLSRYTKRPIGLAVGASKLAEIRGSQLDEKRAQSSVEHFLQNAAFIVERISSACSALPTCRSAPDRRPATAECPPSRRGPSNSEASRTLASTTWVSIGFRTKKDSGTRIRAALGEKSRRPLRTTRSLGAGSCCSFKS